MIFATILEDFLNYQTDVLGTEGLNYFREETENLIGKYLYFNTRIGRDFNISNKIGVEIDIGAIFQLSHDIGDGGFANEGKCQ